MYLFTFSGTAVLLGMGGVCLLIFLGVYLLRLGMRNSKAEAADVFGYAPTVYRVSLCAAIFTSFLAINWTQYDELPVYASVPEQTDEIIEMIPRMTEPPKPAPPPPPPPPPVKIEPVFEDVPAVDMVDQSIEESDFMPPAPVARPQARKVVPPPPPAEEPAIDNTPIIFAERMPVFGEDCRSLPGHERKTCSDRALLSFVQKGLDYPAPARNNGIEGTVVIRFVVEKDGRVSGIEPVRGLGGGCTAAAMAAIERINGQGVRFVPGLQNGEPVRVVFNLPIKFQLDR